MPSAAACFAKMLCATCSSMHLVRVRVRVRVRARVRDRRRVNVRVRVRVRVRVKLEHAPRLGVGREPERLALRVLALRAGL